MSPTPVPGKRRRSRRLRKKLHVGEFRELGFEVGMQFAPGLTANADDAFWAAFIVELIEARGLSYGGAASGFVARTGRGSATAADREAVEAWLARRPEIVGCEVGPLEDAWYPQRDAAEEAKAR